MYSCDPFNRKVPDEAYAEEYAAASSVDIPVALFSAEDFESGDFRVSPPLAAGDEILYRGWMLTPETYGSLQSSIEAKGARAITSQAAYCGSHYLPEWYSVCEEFTPRTVFLSKDADFEAELADLKWAAYFVKDHVKSLTTGRGSVAKSASEVGEIVREIEKYRGQVEGGVCVREFEPLLRETEERYFAFRGKVFARDESTVPPEVAEIAARIESPFISIDVARRNDGTLRLIELGDGQVSDRKKWTADRFVAMLAG